MTWSAPSSFAYGSAVGEVTVTVTSAPASCPELSEERSDAAGPAPDEKAYAAYDTDMLVEGLPCGQGGQHRRGGLRVPSVVIERAVRGFGYLGNGRTHGREQARALKVARSRTASACCPAVGGMSGRESFVVAKVRASGRVAASICTLAAKRLDVI